MAAPSVVQMVLQTGLCTTNATVAVDVARLATALWRPLEEQTSQLR